MGRKEEKVRIIFLEAMEYIDGPMETYFVNIIRKTIMYVTTTIMSPLLIQIHIIFLLLSKFPFLFQKHSVTATTIEKKRRRVILQQLP